MAEAKSKEGTDNTFKQNLEPANLKFFNELTEKSFSDQAIAFLNAFWEEIGDQAEFIYNVSYQLFKEADMHAQGMSYVHLYEEGSRLDFNIGLYFFEKLCKKVLQTDEGKVWRDNSKYKSSIPEMKTAITRKKELREKIDINFDNKMSFLEYLLYQYQDLASPKDFTDRSLKMVTDHPEVLKAKNELKEINKQISEFEQKKHNLKEIIDKGGVKGMSAKHELAILEAGTSISELDRSLISAEASLRKASLQYKEGIEQEPILNGSIWWLEAEINAKKKLYSNSK